MHTMHVTGQRERVFIPRIMYFAHLKAKVAVPLLALCLWNLWGVMLGWSWVCHAGGSAPWQWGRPGSHFSLDRWQWPSCAWDWLPLRVVSLEIQIERPQVTRRAWFLCHSWPPSASCPGDLMTVPCSGLFMSAWDVLCTLMAPSSSWCPDLHL